MRRRANFSLGDSFFLIIFFEIIKLSTAIIMRSAVSTCWFLLLFSSMLLSNKADGQSVVELTEDTFEHQTQASSGGTTGSWIILFQSPTCNSCNKLKPILDELSTDEELYENGIVLGSVDCSTNLSVCQRFSATKLPVLIYFHKKRMYRYPLKREHSEFNNIMVIPDTKKLRSYILRDYGEGIGEPIPDPPSSIDILIQQIGDAYERNPLVGLAIYFMVGMIVLTVLVLLVALIFTATTKTKTKAKSRNNNKQNNKKPSKKKKDE